MHVAPGNGHEDLFQVGPPRAELDILNEASVRAAFNAIKPTLVLNCAAYTKVDLAEKETAAANAINGTAVGTLAKLGKEFSAALVHYSTDYVFDGSLSRPLKPGDPVGPQSAYGRSKLLGETELQAHAPDRWLILRTAWLYGAAGRNFVDTMRRVGAERDEVTVVDDQEGCPTWTRDLAPALEALLDQPPGVYHTAGGGSVTWAGFARAIFEEAGIACRVVPITTEQLGRPAPRPAHAPLAVTRPSAPRLRHWRDALRDYILETA